jgi:hypothetical protein
MLARRGVYGFVFLHSKAAKHLLGEGYTDSFFEVEVDPDKARAISDSGDFPCCGQ